MIVKVFSDAGALADAAAKQASTTILSAIGDHGRARIVVATGTSQFEFLERLVKQPGVDWSLVEMFHLDEYIGMNDSHPASFCRYLREHLIQRTHIRDCHLLNGTKDPALVIQDVAAELQRAPIDVAFVGIGENGHLAFNDPPADFDSSDAYIVVTLDEACRRQQFNEGWFRALEEVPRKAISMTVRQILRTKEILCIVPDGRKSAAVKACFEGEITPMAPASILRTHSNTTVFLDKRSSALLGPSVKLQAM
jgi:glucosamine-6-phosphate deaminase